MSPLDFKALAAIALLWDRKEDWAVITYGDLAKKLGHAQQGLSDILNRVGAWCYSVERQSLAMLVISVEGEPNEGMFRAFPGDTNPVTHKNYERRRVELWKEDWSDVALPTQEDVAAAYSRFRPQ